MSQTDNQSELGSQTPPAKPLQMTMTMRVIFDAVDSNDLEAQLTQFVGKLRGAGIAIDMETGCMFLANGKVVDLPVLEGGGA